MKELLRPPLVQQLVSRCFKQMQGTDIRTHIRLVALGRIFNQIPTSAVTDQWEIHVVSPSAYLVVLEMGFIPEAQPEDSSFSDVVNYYLRFRFTLTYFLVYIILYQLCHTSQCPTPNIINPQIFSRYSPAPSNPGLQTEVSTGLRGPREPGTHLAVDRHQRAHGAQATRRAVSTVSL